jgi:diadenylate cyclase
MQMEDGDVMGFFQNLFDRLTAAFSEYVMTPVMNIGVFDILDILLLSYIFYMVYAHIRERRAATQLIGLIILYVLHFVTGALEMSASYEFFNAFYDVGAIVVLIIFREEICDLVDKIGSGMFSLRNIGKRQSHTLASVTATIAVLSDTAVELSRERTGALIVVERNSKLGEYIKNGVMIDGVLSCELLGNLFYNHSPLHDGAVIIRDGKVCAAGCILPSSKSTALPKELGTRHRAAVGISEQSDAVVIVVSEETGGISIANNGVLKRGYTSGTLKDDLFLLLTGDNNKVKAGKHKSK